jgi:hypothetical protein
MFETTQDWFYLISAFCIVWVSVFLCWALYYCVRVLRQTDEVMTELRERIAKATSIFTFLKNKLVSQGVKGAMALFNSFAGKKKK